MTGVCSCMKHHRDEAGEEEEEEGCENISKMMTCSVAVGSSRKRGRNEDKMIANICNDLQSRQTNRLTVIARLPDPLLVHSLAPPLFLSSPLLPHC